METFTFSFEAIGTKWVIDCFEAFTSKKKVEILIQKRVEEFDKTYSRFRKDSLVWKISEKTGEYIFPEDSKDFFTTYDKFYKVTNGLFTPLIGNTLSEAGYDLDYSLVPKKINKVPEVSTVYSWDYPKLITKKPYILDFGGLGKGYLVDIISGLLKENGVKSFCVDGGGDMICSNLKEPMRVGLENPKDEKQVIGVVELNNKSVCASSGNRRRWDKYHHIMNPKTLESTDEILATWVIANDAITADGLATSLFLTPVKTLIKYFDFEYFILYPDFKFEKSNNFSSEIFVKA